MVKWQMMGSASEKSLKFFCIIQVKISSQNGLRYRQDIWTWYDKMTQNSQTMLVVQPL